MLRASSSVTSSSLFPCVLDSFRRCCFIFSLLLPILAHRIPPFGCPIAWYQLKPLIESSSNSKGFIPHRLLLLHYNIANRRLHTFVAFLLRSNNDVINSLRAPSQKIIPTRGNGSTLEKVKSCFCRTCGRLHKRIPSHRRCLPRESQPVPTEVKYKPKTEEEGMRWWMTINRPPK